MSSATLVAEFRRLNADLTTLAQRDLASFWPTLDTSDVAVARDALTEFSTALVDTYGRPAALIASTFYDDMRALSPNATGKFTAVMADPIPAEQVAATARWAVEPLVGDAPDSAAALDRMSGSVQRYVSQAGRDTISRNARRDRNVSYARVPGYSKSGNCDFCLMLASRGAAYGSEESAKYAKDGDKYHDDCHCVPTPMWQGDPYPEGYDPDALFEDYEARQATAQVVTP